MLACSKAREIYIFPMEKRFAAKPASLRSRKGNLQTAAEFIPEELTMEKLQRASKGCTACPLWKSGTQTVFGEGLQRAELVLVGEQPGDREDLEGRPFVGPAGR